MSTIPGLEVTELVLVPVASAVPGLEVAEWVPAEDEANDGINTTHAPDIVRQPAGHAISGHPKAISFLVMRQDWPWRDDFAPLDAPQLLPQGSHDAYINPKLGYVYIGFTAPRAGAWE